MRMNEYGLTEKQDRYCHEYIKDFNATAAYIRAGYRVLQRKTGAQNASILMKNPKVQSRIKSLQGKLNETSLIQATTVIRELARIGLANIKHLTQYDPLTKLFYVPDLRDLTDDVTAAIKKIRTAWVSIEVKPGKWKSKQVFVVEMHDKLKALELAGRHLGLWEQDEKGINISFNYNTQKPKKSVDAGVSTLGADIEDVESEEVKVDEGGPTQNDTGDQADINEEKLND